MPIYEYHCDACGHECEFLQKISDEHIKKCPACSKSKLQKLVSAVGFQLKGTGWYETDFKTKKNDKKVSTKTDKPNKKNTKTKETTGTKKD